MSTPQPPDDPLPHAGQLRPSVLVLATLGYVVAAAVATYPVITTATSALPGHLSDPLEHLWIMRWAERCLQEGRSPWFCPDSQYPAGVPLGLFPTLHVQTLGYLALGWLTSNDILRFNLLWGLGFVSTGLASFVLAWTVVRRVDAAWLGGLGVMLCGPMLMHAHGHLETMQMGPVPLFLLAWLRFLDAPSGRRLTLAVGAYLLMVACAPYFAVLAVVPAAWAVAWSVASVDRANRLGWVRSRSPWLVGFSALSLPGLALLFAPQLWATRHGYTLTRSKIQFDWFGAPVWSYLAPTPKHALGHALGTDLYATHGYGGRMFECESYLGVMVLGLLGYALVRRVQFARAGLWWTTLAVLVVLSWGARGPFGVTLPAGWLHRAIPLFHLIRVPARFNLFAAAVAVVPVAAAFRDLLDRLPGRWERSAVVAAATLVTLADLSVVPFPTAAIPPMPRVYRDLVAKNPNATFLDAPMFGSSQGHVLGSLCGYWQSIHRGRTSAGYSGVANTRYDAEIELPSPWSARGMADQVTLDAPAGPVAGATPHDRAWLFLTSHGYNYLVLHQGATLPANYARSVGAWKTELAEALISEDADVAVFERARLRPPGHPVALIGAGWLPAEPSPAGRFLTNARLGVTVFNPHPNRPVHLALKNVAATGTTVQAARLVDAGGQVLARWSIPPRSAAGTLEATVWLPLGIHHLSIETDATTPNPAASVAAHPTRKAPGFLFSALSVTSDPTEVARRPEPAVATDRR